MAFDPLCNVEFDATALVREPELGGACEAVDSVVRRLEVSRSGRPRLGFNAALERLQSLAARVTLAGCPIPMRLEVRDYDMLGALFFVHLQVAPRREQVPTSNDLSKEARISACTPVDPEAFNSLADRQVVLWMARRCAEAAIHEIREWFRFGDRLAFDPHAGGRSDTPSPPWVWTAG